MLDPACIQKDQDTHAHGEQIDIEASHIHKDKDIGDEACSNLCEVILNLKGVTKSSSYTYVCVLLEWQTQLWVCITPSLGSGATPRNRPSW